ncbi:MAG: hypothetical protein AB8H80_12900 [Planctomycetota bacterium]
MRSERTQPRNRLTHLALALAAMLATISSGRAQEGVPKPSGLVPEQMWYAPTAEDWAKPVRIRWQRTWADAVKLSQQTKKPLLVCVNMDGEIASEHYAGVRYRDPELAKLFEPYVCVIASTYRHNPRDYDDEGRRIPCPRLGCVTCGEHIAMEPIVYKKFLDGKRISPRHIMVELDGSEVYDVFYTWDVESVFQTLDEGIKNRKIQAQPIVKGDRSLRERLLSPDSEDREQIEREFATASADEKKRMLDLGIEAGKDVPLELLRQASRSLDPAMQSKARQGLLKTEEPLAVELIADTLQAPLPQQERESLVSALERFGEQSTHARTLATAHRGLDAGTSAIDGKKWQSVLVGEAYQGRGEGDGFDQMVAQATERDAALAAKPDDPNARLDVAESSLMQALELADREEQGLQNGPGAARLYRRQRALLLEDTERNLERAETAGLEGWRTQALRAALLAEQGRRQQAFQLAAKAMPAMPPEAPGRLAKEILELFAHGRQFLIRQAVRQKKQWPGEWTGDVHTAYTLLLRHPLGSDIHVADHYDFLQFFRSPDAEAVLTEGIQRFPASARLHQRVRGMLLSQGGIDALRSYYKKALQQADHPLTLPWFAGYADLVIAEQHRRNQKPQLAQQAYREALTQFEDYATATGNDDGAHYQAMAHAGLARLALQRDDLDLTFSELQQVFQLRASAAAATDGLGVTAMQTAEMLRGRALSLEDPDLAERLDAVLEALPDEAYVLPEYEQKSQGRIMGRRPSERRR